MCARIDRERYADNPLATSARTAQPLSPEADPFVQGETLGDGSRGCRNDLEWRSRELAGLEADLKAREVYEGPGFFFSLLLEPDSQAAPEPVTSLMNSECYCFQSGCVLFSRQVESFTNLFEPFALIVRGKIQNLTGKMN